MKKVFTPIIFLICLAIIMFVVFANANKNIMTNERALEIGEEKYLKFLWMIDGAFNSERMNEDFIVNNKSLAKEDKIFTCKYKDKKSNECIGNNFEQEFQKLFSKTIDYNDVYSDRIMYTWYDHIDGKDVFTVLDSCDVDRMNTNQKLEIFSIKENEIIYNASFKNERTNKITTRNFILIFEDNDWKIKKAFYHDICAIKYNID